MKANPEIAALICLAETFAAARSLSLKTVSVYAAGQGLFFDRLKNGHSVTLRRRDLLLQWFSENWPEDAKWPSDVPRPGKVDAA